MSVICEGKKLKRTGFAPLFAGGGLLAAAVPVLNMGFREELYTGQSGNPLHILLAANWQMIGMLNLFLVLIGACVLYHIEYRDCALRKMDMLPLSKPGLFFSKCLMLFGGCCGAVVLETVSLGFCIGYWFSLPDGWAAELSAHLGFSLLVLAPVVILMTAISSTCSNMWVTLGIGLLGSFVPIAVGQTDSALIFFPFSMPLEFLQGMDGERIFRLALAACAEGILFSGAAVFYQKKRGSM